MPKDLGSNPGECHIFYLFRCVFFLCYTGEALEGPISTGVSNKLNIIDSNNGILMSENTILYMSRHPWHSGKRAALE